MNKKEREQDLGIKIGTKDEAFWQEAKDNYELILKQYQDKIKITKAILEKISEELEAAKKV